MAITTPTKYNFDKAENELFSWSHFDGTNGNTLTYKPTGKQIYRMMWYEWKNSTDITDPEIIAAVKAFWAELEILKNQKPPRREEDYEDVDPEPKHGVNGYCRKCHGYCYGDCEASRR